MIELSDIYTQAENIVTRKVMDEILLVPICGDIASMENIFTLNSSGYFIWTLLENELPLSAVVERMSDHYGLRMEIVQQDVCELIVELKASGLVNHQAERIVCE